MAWLSHPDRFSSGRATRAHRTGWIAGDHDGVPARRLRGVKRLVSDVQEIDSSTRVPGEDRDAHGDCYGYHIVC